VMHMKTELVISCDYRTVDNAACVRVDTFVAWSTVAVIRQAKQAGWTMAPGPPVSGRITICPYHSQRRKKGGIVIPKQW
jgi:hypothetical protein